MAEGGFFDRLSNLWSGFWSLWIGGAEKKNPEAVYEAAINERIRSYKALKKAVSNIIYLRNKITKELEQKNAELKEVSAQIPIAVDEGEDEVALHLIENKDTLQSEITQLNADMDKTATEAEEAKSSLVTFQSEIDKLRKEKDEMLARKETAEARIKIQETLDGLSTDADIKALDNVRQHIGKMQAEADMGSELGDATLDTKLKKIKAKAGTAAARQQLDAIKQARAAQVAEAAAKKNI
jgi:phage shock protein A